MAYLFLGSQKELIQAVIDSNAKRISLCLKRNASLSVENDLGAGAIHYVITHCLLDPLDMLEKLLRAGADVNMRTYVRN